jgi:hypothetical protein
MNNHVQVVTSTTGGGANPAVTIDPKLRRRDPVNRLELHLTVGSLSGSLFSCHCAHAASCSLALKTKDASVKTTSSCVFAGLCQLSWRFTYVCWNIPIFDSRAKNTSMRTRLPRSGSPQSQLGKKPELCGNLFKMSVEGTSTRRILHQRRAFNVRR